MPYIHKAHRETFKPALEEIGYIASVGELNYLISSISLMYLGSKPDYAKFNDVIGALEAAKLEFYRRAVVPYENDKIVTNGDIYD